MTPKTAAARPKAKKDDELVKSQMDLITEAGFSSIQEFLSSLGLTAVAKEDGVKKGSRVAVQRAWLDKKELDPDERDAVEQLPVVIGTGVNLVEPTRTLAQEEIDSLMAEAQVERRVEDILKGRSQAIKNTVFSGLTAKLGDEDAPGYLASPAHGAKFVRQVATMEPSVDWNALSTTLDPATWESITDQVTSREVNLDKLTKAIQDGVIKPEQIQEVTEPGGVRKSFYVRPLKRGDEIDV